MFLNVSETAIDKIAEYIEMPSQLLRIKVVGGGCSGLRYELMMDEMCQKMIWSLVVWWWIRRVHYIWPDQVWNILTH